MKLRPSILVLAGTISALIIVWTTAAAAKGGKGNPAAVNIDIIRLLDPSPQGGKITAEISGGGFESGSIEVYFDGGRIAHSVLGPQMLEATIPKRLYAEGDHTITVKTGDENNQIDSAAISLGGVMSVSCISWFVSGPEDEHVHTEVHVEDENGDAVIGATVMLDARYATGNEPYQTNTSLTNDNDGHAAGENCPVDGDGNPDVSGSGVTDWFCCIGAGKWDSDGPPGKRACAAGEYTATIINVTAPLFTNMTWDEVIVVTEFTLEDTQFP